MDATRLRTLVDGALDAKRLLLAAMEARKAAERAEQEATERHDREVGNLSAALQGGAVLYGDKVIRTGPDGGFRGITVLTAPVSTLPVLAPPPPPLPEAPPPPPAPKPKADAPPPSGGKPTGKK